MTGYFVGDIKGIEEDLISSEYLEIGDLKLDLEGKKGSPFQLAVSGKTINQIF